MKKSMVITGYIATAFLSIGVVFKFLHWPGAGPALVLGIFIHAIYFLPIYGYRKFYELSGNKSKIIGALGAMALSFAALGFLFKIMHFPGAGPLLIFGFGFPAFILLPVFIIQKIFSSDTKKQKIWNISGYLALILFLAGYLFKIMIFPVHGVFFILSLVFSLFIYLPLTISIYKNEQERQKLVTFFFNFSLFAVFVGFMIAMTVSRWVLVSFVVIEDGINQTADYLKIKNEEFYARFDKQNYKNLKESAMYYHKAMKVKELSGTLNRHIEDLKIKLVMKVDNLENEKLILDTTGQRVDPGKINAKDNMDIGGEVMIVKGEGQILKARIAVYLSDILSMYDGEMKEIAKKSIGLNTADLFNPEVGTVSWESNLFEQLPFIAVITNLSKIQADIKYAESVTVEYLYNEAEKAIAKNRIIVSDTVYYDGKKK